LAAALLAACADSSMPHGRSAPGEVRFSILSAEAVGRIEPFWRPILADMQRETGFKVTPFFSSNDSLMVEALRQARTDLGWFSNSAGLEAVRRGGGEVFARAFDADGVDGYASVIIAAATSQVTLAEVVRCRRKLSLGMGEPRSVSGNLAPVTYLFAPADIDPQTCFRQVRRSPSPLANLVAVAHGQLDLAASSTAFLALQRRRGRKEADAVRVIWRSPVLPGDPLIWRRDLDPAVKEKLREFFLTYGQGDDAAGRQRSRLASLNIGGFRPADDSHLLPVREMDATQTWLAARRTGDRLRIAAARQALDTVTAQRVALEARTRSPAAAQ
jgi:phosphonate transport system substrate-binding protein